MKKINPKNPSSMSSSEFQDEIQKAVRIAQDEEGAKKIIESLFSPEILTTIIDQGDSFQILAQQIRGEESVDITCPKGIKILVCDVVNGERWPISIVDVVEKIKQDEFDVVIVESDWGDPPEENAEDLQVDVYLSGNINLAYVLELLKESHPSVMTKADCTKSDEIPVIIVDCDPDQIAEFLGDHNNVEFHVSSVSS